MIPVILLWFAILILVEMSAMYSIKYSTLHDDKMWMWIGIFCYAAVGFCLYHIVEIDRSIGMTNVVWNIASTMYGLLIGVLLFSETISHSQTIGIILGILGLMFIGYGNKKQ